MADLSVPHRPSPSEILSLSVRARKKADPPQTLLVAALTEFLIITGPFVRAGRSMPVMCSAFDEGVTALMNAANATDPRHG